MYNFIDVNEVSGSALLPSEALKINGEYIENLIPGYRTLSVSGREALSPELNSYETGVRDGSSLKSKRYPARYIIVKYQLIAETSEAFREAYNKLAHILDVENAELIFDDEPDKFFTGTPSAIGEVEPGRNAVTGEFEIFCADPFKYSVIEYEAEPDLEEGSILIDYNGTYKSFPTLQAEFFSEKDTSEDGEIETELTGNGDCGYVAFFNEYEKIIQLGDPDEVDGTTVAKSQTLVNSSFKKSTDWGTAAKKIWKVNSGITSSSAVVQTGTMGIAIADYAETETTTTSGTLLNATSKANAPTIHYKLTAKATNRTEKTVKVTVSIKTWLDKDSNYFGRGYGLKGHVYIGGAWHEVVIKNTSAYWKGKSGHTVNVVVTVSGLSANTTALTGIKFKTTRIDSLGTAGLLNAVACSNLKISKYVVATPDTYYLTPSNFGSGSDWHGASITRVLPADASGDVGAKNFVLSYSQKMSIGSGKNDGKQLGAFQVLLVSGSGSSRKIVCGVNVYKGSNGKKAKLRFYMNDGVAQTMDIDLSHNNKYFKSSKTSTITKSGETVTFNICGIKKTFRDSGIKDVLVNEVTFTISQFGTKTKLAYNGLYSAKFVKNNCDTWKEVPNKFSADDIVEADCRNGLIYLNGVEEPSLGALGNDWEEFYLTPGLNQIGFSYSDWVEAAYAPSFKVKYREVFL